MAEAKKCDICHGYYDPYQSVKLEDGIEYIGCKLRFDGDNNPFSWTELDLCQECMTKVHTLLCNISNEKD